LGCFDVEEAPFPNGILRLYFYLGKEQERENGEREGEEWTNFHGVFGFG
jgi:hypothetical protein